MAKSPRKKVTARKPATRKITVRVKPATTRTARTTRRSVTGKLKGINKLPGNIVNIRHMDFKADKPMKKKPAGIKYEVFRRLKDTPKVEIALEPKEGDYIVFHTMPGFTANDKKMGQISVLAFVTNKDTKTIDLDKVVIEYKRGNVTSKKTVYLPSDQLIIDPWYTWGWQNSRPYHESGDVLFLEEPFPDKIVLNFHFKGYGDPVKLSKKLKPFDTAFALPFKSKDLDEDEFITGYSMHGGGDQVFAYDLGAQGYDKNGWYDVHPNKDYTKNENFRIWGMPVYAMADGKVIHFENNIPNNTKLDGSDENMEKQKKDYWGSFDYGGGGNHFYIKHGNHVALYAHLQKGSLNSKFMQNGKTVKKGDYLGKAGNSGNSTGPHLHIHIKKYKSDSEPEGGIFRPLVFNNGFVIGTANYTKPKSNVNWSKLNKHGVPGLKSKACFIWPSSVHPYCEYPTNWGEVCRFGVPEKDYQKEFDKVWPCGYYPVWVDGYDSGNQTYFNVIFRRSEGIGWAARHNMTGSSYQSEFKKFDDAGYRLVNVNSYLLKGKIRYAAVWTNQSGPDWFAYHGKSLKQHEKEFDGYVKKGWVPVNVSCTASGGKILVTALWEKKNTGGFYLRPVMTIPQYKEFFNEYTNKKKYKLVYLDAYKLAGIPLLSGIWYKNAPGFNSWWAKHHLNANEFQSEYNSMLGNGYLTKCIAGYRDGSAQRFEGIWAK